jgi:hypothetical protein
MYEQLRQATECRSPERFHDAFFRCLLANRDVAGRLTLREQSDTHLTFGIVGVTDTMSIIASPSEISVSATYEGVCWDLVADFFADTEAVPGGYVCSCCKDQSPEVFPTREVLWAELVFRPLLDWFREDLARAEHLVFYGSSDYGFTAARLIPGRLPPAQRTCAHSGTPGNLSRQEPRGFVKCHRCCVVVRSVEPVTTPCT